MTSPAHALPAGQLAAGLGSDATSGLSAAEAARRLAAHGPNELARQRRPPYARIALRQLLDPLVALLIGAAALSAAIGEVGEAAAIAAILVLDGALGFWQETAAERAILALSRAFTRTAAVVRDGVERLVPAAHVVPGDLLLLRAGDRVPADARVVEAASLELDESVLTGESLPVAKQSDPVPADAALGERSSMVYAATAVAQGSGRALVTATGPETEVGLVERLAAAAKPPPTPLARRLALLSRQMVLLGLAITIGLGAAIRARGGAWDDALLTAVAVAVAAVPEGLAATVTAALALGAQTLARRGAIVRRLPAIETLGETTVVCTDKTGTLTENAIRVAGLRPRSGVGEPELLEAAILASSAHVVGEPIETALSLAAMERGVDPEELRRERERVHDIPFSPERRRSTAVYREADGLRAYAKGAPEALAELANEPADDLLETAAAWADEGLRVLAIGSRSLSDGHPLEPHAVERGLRLLGVVALHDPLRASSAPAVASARDAGIQIRMVTGDHPSTARSIGRALGIGEDAILARATPAEKLALVEGLQAAGEVVAVTGDGVNDAPALRRADVGVAMGRSGTELAREASAIVLTDDDFATIVAAIAEGRRIADGIRTFVGFLLSANLGEVLVFAVAVAAGLGAPLTVVQVLLVNLVTDGLPAVALARDPAGADTMSRPPRRGGALFDRRTWTALGLIGLLVGAVTFASFAIGRPGGAPEARTLAFATLSLAELALVYGLRSPSAAAWQAPRNRWLDASVAGSLAIVVAALFLPVAHTVLGTVSPAAWQLAVAASLGVVPLGAVELAKAVRRRPRRPRPAASTRRLRVEETGL